MSFEDQGYVHLPGVFSADEVEALRADLAAHTSRDGTWKEGRQKKRGLSIQPDVHIRPIWVWAAMHLLPPLREVMGTPMECYASLALIKPKETGQRFPWHQDSAYYGDPKRPFVIATVYLDEVTETNGSLQVVPRSHTAGLRTHLMIPQSDKRKLPPEIGTTAVLVPAVSGDVLIMHRHLVHGSLPNQSDQPRRSVRLVFRSAS